MKKFFFTERAVVQAVQIWSAPARYSAGLLGVFEEDPLVEARRARLRPRARELPP
jgi:hypothetical protein